MGGGWGWLDQDPRRVLEDGIRRQLRQLALIELRTALPAGAAHKAAGGMLGAEEFEGRLGRLGGRMGALRESVEYFQVGLCWWHLGWGWMDQTCGRGIWFLFFSPGVGGRTLWSSVGCTRGGRRRTLW